MDNNLKKLSRVELLELLISLSEDYQALAEENAQLKNELSAQRKCVPRSAKVGSLAEAAFLANGYYEAAQRSADGYLREIKHLRDELAKRAEGQARSEAQARAAAAQAERQAHFEMQQAQARADQVVARANAQAQAILESARAQAEETIRVANHRAYATRYREAYSTDAPVQAASRNDSQVVDPLPADSRGIDSQNSSSEGRMQ
jgi:cell division septum initiation protein DivIVA